MMDFCLADEKQIEVFDKCGGLKTFNDMSENILPFVWFSRENFRGDRIFHQDENGVNGETQVW
jgi:hypothetical protein